MFELIVEMAFKNLQNYCKKAIYLGCHGGCKVLLIAPNFYKILAIFIYIHIILHYNYGTEVILIKHL